MVVDHRAVTSLPEHPQHALRDEEAARDVDRGEQDGDAARAPARPAPPPYSASMPPMTMMPLIALVTLISGVCSAGVTFQTTCQPTTHASRNTVRCWRNSGGPKIAGGAQQDRRQRRDHVARCRSSGRRLAAPWPAAVRVAAAASAWARRRGARRGAVRRRPHQLAVLEDDRAALDLVLEVDRPAPSRPCTSP